jgi:hypothetical protein
MNAIQCSMKSRKYREKGSVAGFWNFWSVFKGDESGQKVDEMLLNVGKHKKNVT